MAHGYLSLLQLASFGVLVLELQFDTVVIIVVVFERSVLAIKGGKERTLAYT